MKKAIIIAVAALILIMSAILFREMAWMVYLGLALMGV